MKEEKDLLSSNSVYDNPNKDVRVDNPDFLEEDDSNETINDFIDIPSSNEEELAKTRIYENHEVDYVSDETHDIFDEINIARKPEENKAYIDNSNKGNYNGYLSRITKKSIVPVLSLIFAITFYLLAINSKKINQVTVKENGSATYQVCYRENNEYNTNCLEEDKEYLSTLTNEINSTLSYEAVYSEAEEKNVTYYVTADIVITRNNESKKVLYAKEYFLQNEKNYTRTKNVISINSNIVIPYEEYNQIATDYISKYVINANANLEVSLYIKEDNNTRKVSTLNIPLATQSYNITKDLYNNESSYVTSTSINSIGKFYYCASIICVISFLLTFVGLLFNLNKYKVKDNKYIKELNKILKEYDRVIVETNDTAVNLNKKNIIKLDSFQELIDARDTVEKPILYVKVNNVKSIFYVVDSNTVYRYVMKEANFK